ncbi:hypothetical protein EYF80_005605 [Liparis tanakae]|uniref:Uncharacterized protein n=1 Tax=Liparis tanakae TaxID=230148 RepID=A0A4Z2J3K7_9TELE|nr:hypothetical protein EYF80_005605 [Liparis tanakae]
MEEDEIGEQEGSAKRKRSSESAGSEAEDSKGEEEQMGPRQRGGGSEEEEASRMALPAIECFLFQANSDCPNLMCDFYKVPCGAPSLPLNVQNKTTSVGRVAQSAEALFLDGL